ncbi:MAG: hypothetical protein Q4A83_08465 [Bacillota bacterium]|nr:hypothetical protein [Bacillota bacterium]
MEELTYRDLIGKTILIGITYCITDDEVIDQKQFWGTVIEANETVINVKQENGTVISLPPDLRSTKPAQKGEYRLQSTGEVITDPDFTSVWVIKINPDEILKG